MVSVFLVNFLCKNIRFPKVSEFINRCSDTSCGYFFKYIFKILPQKGLEFSNEFIDLYDKTNSDLAQSSLDKGKDLIILIPLWAFRIFNILTPQGWWAYL